MAVPVPLRGSRHLVPRACALDVNMALKKQVGGAVFLPVFHGHAFEDFGVGCSYHQTTVRIAALPLSRHEGQ
jgi:hypothetical protein